MNYKQCTALSLLVCAITPVLATGWGAESNVNGPDKNNIDIYGTLETRGSDERGNPIILNVNNISFGGVFKDIPVYSLPTKGDYNADSRALLVDPTTKYLKVDMQLIDKNNNPKITEIRVDNPGIIWTYKDPTRSHAEKIEYIEMTFKACTGKEETYLIATHPRKKLMCNQKKAPFERMEVPLAGIKRLTIEGAKPREDKEGCGCQPTPACPVTQQDTTPDPIDDQPKTSRNSSNSGLAMPAVSTMGTSGAHFAPGMHVGK